jgi:hypothetical protein
MNQQHLFCEDIYEALRNIGQAYGKPKAIGALLWPEMNPDKAGERWANCLNRTRAEKLDPEQVLLILKLGRQVGCHVGIDYIARECNYKWETIEPEDERAKLMREFNESVKLQDRIVKRLESLHK